MMLSKLCLSFPPLGRPRSVLSSASARVGLVRAEDRLDRHQQLRQGTPEIERADPSMHDNLHAILATVGTTLWLLRTRSTPMVLSWDPCPNTRY